MKKLLLISVLSLASLSVSGAAKSPYDIPSLHKAKFEKAPVHAPLVMQKNGKLRFAIVCDLKRERSSRIEGLNKGIGASRWSVSMASSQLQQLIQRCLGEKPPILSPDSPKLANYPLKIYLGRSKFTDKMGIDITKLPPDGFVVRTVKDGIVIVGHDGSMIPNYYKWNDMGTYAANGTLCAVFDFAERFLGMRFYYPGLGVIAPQKKNFVIQPVSYSDAPEYLTRLFGNTTISFHNKNEKQRRIGLGYSAQWPWDDIPNDQGMFIYAYRLRSRASRWMCSEGPSPFRVAKAFPDKLDICFYREKNGRLRQSLTQYTANYFDVSNMKFADLLVDSFKKFYESKGKVNLLWDNTFIPNPEYMYFGPVDAGCIIDNKRTAHLPKRKEAYATMSEINAQFYLYLAKRLEKELPGKKIAVMAYANYLGAPHSVKKFPDNLRIMACSGTPVFIRDKASENFWKKLYSDWNSKTNGKVTVYPYDPAYNMQGGIAHAIRGEFEGEYLKKMKPYISTDTIFPCVYFRWDYYYSVYLISRAYWDPDFNVQAAMDEHWKLLYGPAAPILKEFYAYVLKRWTDHYIPKAKINKGCIPGLDYETLYRTAYPPAVLKVMQGYLSRAERAVKKGSVEARRVNFFVMPWQRIMNEAMAWGNLKAPPAYKLVFNDVPVKIDGILNESSWKKARKIKFKSAYYGEDKKLPAPDARFMWDDNGIYLSVHAKAPYRKVGKLWSDDNFEFFISPGRSKNKLFQFVLSSSGEYEDYFQSFDPPRPLEAVWKCKGIKKAVVADKKGWTAEVFIPFSALDGSPAPLPGDSWFANIISNRNNVETTSYAPTMGKNRNMNFYARFHFAGNFE